jgi:hypothetical protein
VEVLGAALKVLCSATQGKLISGILNSIKRMKKLTKLQQNSPGKFSHRITQPRAQHITRRNLFKKRLCLLSQKKKLIISR